MEQTIEERADQRFPAEALCDYGAHYDGYVLGATEQKQIDEEENAKALLYAVNKTAERTRKEMIEKADRWLRTHLPRVISNYPFGNKRTDMLNEDMREEFRKAMEQ